MTINSVPDRGAIAKEDARTKELVITPSWSEFFKSIFNALFGWKRSYTGLLTFNFGNIAAGGEETTTVAVIGARAGDLVLVTSTSLVAGLGVDGMVMANDTVTVRRFNFSTGPVNPASDNFRVVVLQQ